MNITLLTILVLTISIQCQTSAPSVDVFTNIKQHYNAQQFDQIYALITSNERITQADFVGNLSTQFSNYGPIAYNFSLLQRIHDSHQYFMNIVVYKNSMQLGYIHWETLAGNITYMSFENSQNYTQPSLVQFISANKNKFSLSIILDDQETVGFNPNIGFPINGYFAIPIILEYARQVDINMINPETMVSVNKIKCFYIPNLDHNFDNFYSYAQNQSLIVQNSVSLKTLAEGAIKFESPALFEYLQIILGLTNVNDMLLKSGLNQPNQIYPVSTMLSLSNYKSLSKAKYANYLKNITTQQLDQAQQYFQSKLLKGDIGAEFLLKNLYKSFQSKVYSNAVNKLVGKMTTKEYAKLFNDLYDGKILTSSARKIFQLTLTPASSRQPFMATMFKEFVAAIEIRNFFQAVGHTKLINPVGGLSKISFALFVKGLDNMQSQAYLGDLSFITLFIISDPNFCKDLVSRIQP